MPFQLEEYQRVLFPYAYNILGSAEDARDVIQDIMIKWQSVEQEKIENQKAYLIRSVINAAINYKSRQKDRLQDYPGQWLPEPLTIDTEMDRRHILSYSLLVLLEQLNPKERAIFILKESFDFSHQEIAEQLDITPESSRQLLKRSKERLNPNIAPQARDHDEKIKRFVDLIINGNTKALEQMLAADIKVISDGGKEAPAAKNIIEGIERTQKLLLGIFKKFLHQYELHFTTANHQPAIAYTRKGQVRTCHILTFNEAGEVERIHIIVNREKLKNFKINF